MNSFIKIKFLVIIYFAYFNEYIQAELTLLNVVFRHGDRAPANVEVNAFPSLFANKTFFSVTSGGLTNKGKIREFHLGQYLRRQYGDFLGDIYLPENLEARSTDSSRTKMSLQLVLAGLYPPKGVQRWNDKLNWQPIPFNYIPSLNDVLMLPIECPKYLEAREQIETLPTIRKKLQHFKDLMKYLTIKTGTKVKNSFDIFLLYHTLMSISSMNVKLPSWTKGIFPHGQLYDATVLEYEISSYNDKLKRLNGGMLLRKIIENMYERAKNPSSKRKIYLYSGHDVNVAHLLQALDVYQYDIPRYSSAVIVELHEESQRYFVKIKYYKGFATNQSIDEELYNPHCHANCSLDNLTKLLNNVIPSDIDIKCDKRSLNGTLDWKINVYTAIKKQVLGYLLEEEKNRNVLY